MAKQRSIPKTKRIATLDLLRGYFLIVILVNHFNHFPGFFDIFTGRGALWASAAEGFFLVAGIMVGLIRGREAKNGQLWSAVKKLWKRAVLLYVCAIGLTLLFTIIGWQLVGQAGLKPGLSGSSFIGTVWETITLQYIYGWADFLQFYAVYLLAAPLALWLLVKRLWWVVIILSLAVFTQRSHSHFVWWQLYFFIGTVVGFYLQSIENWGHKLPREKRQWGLALLYGLSLVTLAISVMFGVVRPFIISHPGFLTEQLSSLKALLVDWGGTVDPWFDRWSNYGLGRLPIALLWFSALYVFVRSHEAKVEKYLGGLLMPLGQNALLVYSFDAALLFGLVLVSPTDKNILANVALSALAIGLSWYVAVKYGAYNQRRKATRAG